jgi:phosphohistidine phosphatase
MKLYFLRHAEAVDGLDDAARALSPRGRREAREIGRFLEDAGVAFNAAYTSPLVRARETAEIVLDTCGAVSVEQLQITNMLLNETANRQFLGWIRALTDFKHVLLVGHAPSMDEWLAALLGIESVDVINLPKGGLACVKTDDGRSGRLKFLITPGVLGAS